MPVTKAKVEEALQKVIDPEIDCDIFSMGLVYEINIKDDGSIHILHTLTSPMCPMGPQIQADIRSALVDIGFQDISIELTFDPPWEAPAELRTMLGLP